MIGTYLRNEGVRDLTERLCISRIKKPVTKRSRMLESNISNDHIRKLLNYARTDVEKVPGTSVPRDRRNSCITCNWVGLRI
jgi:hypothetical protein